MPIEVKFTAEGAAALRDDVLALASFLRGDDAPAPMAEPQPNAADNPVQPPAEPPKRRGRPPKSEQAKPVIAAEADDTPVPFAEPAEEKAKPAAPVADNGKRSASIVYGPEASRQALHALVETSGLDAGKKLLGEFGAMRVSDLKKDQHAEFYARCKAEVIG